MALEAKGGFSVHDLLHDCVSLFCVPNNLTHSPNNLTTNPHKQIVDTAMILQDLRLRIRLPVIEVRQSSVEPNRHKLAHA